MSVRAGLAALRPQVAPIAAITLFGVSMSMSYPLFGLMLERTGASGAMIGLNTAAAAITMVAGAPLMPMMLRRIGIGPLLIGSALALAATMLAIPLYHGFWYWTGLRLAFGFAGTVLFFASELKAIRAYPGFAPKIDRDALTLFFRYNYIPSPYSIFQGIRKLPPASSAVFSAREGPNSPGHPVAYWNFPAVASQGELAPFTGSEPELEAELEALLTDAVALAMGADVRPATFLSAVCGSSTLVPLLPAMEDRGDTRGIASLCIGGGEGAAVAIEME